MLRFIITVVAGAVLDKYGGRYSQQKWNPWIPYLGIIMNNFGGKPYKDRKL